MPKISNLILPFLPSVILIVLIFRVILNVDSPTGWSWLVGSLIGASEQNMFTPQLPSHNLIRVFLSFALVIATLPIRSNSQTVPSVNTGPDSGYKTATLPSRNLPKLDELLRNNAPNVKKEKVKNPPLQPANRCRPNDLRCLKFWLDKGKPNDNKIGQLDAPRQSYNAFAQLLAANNAMPEARAAWQSFSDVPLGLNIAKPVAKVAAAPMLMQSNWPVYSNLWTELAQRRNQQGTGGEDLYSGNYNWSVPIVGLPGRAGHDLGLSLSYNSHIWVRTDTGMRMVDYIEWYSTPGYGFSVGLPRLNSYKHVARGSSTANANHTIRCALRDGGNLCLQPGRTPQYGHCHDRRESYDVQPGNGSLLRV